MKVNIQDAINCVNVDLNETTCENCRLFGLDYSVCAEVDKIKLEALEKQIPKKVIKERGEYYTISRDGIEGYLIYFECPSCGNKLLHKNFPCKCGQKLDWGD